MSIFIRRKNWMLRIGRDFERDMSASIFFGCVSRINPPEGEYRWRYRLEWAWDWLPTIRWRCSFSTSRIRESHDERLLRRMARDIAKLPIKIFKRDGQA